MITISNVTRAVLNLSIIHIEKDISNDINSENIFNTFASAND